MLVMLLLRRGTQLVIIPGLRLLRADAAHTPLL